jgi:CDP-4-dehydro-6-deoxyglucose reductase
LQASRCVSVERVQDYNDIGPGRCHLKNDPDSFTVRIEPGGHELRVAADENVLAVALAAGLALPHSCRGGRCASCKAKLLDGEIAYPDDRLPPGIVAAEAARGEVLLCQARPRSNLRIATRAAAETATATGVVAASAVPIATGGRRTTLSFVGTPLADLRPGRFIDVETAGGERERVAVVAVSSAGIDVELHELEPQSLVRARGPFDSLR